MGRVCAHGRQRYLWLLLDLVAFCVQAHVDFRRSGAWSNKAR
jgi:hypothetical protein